MTIKNILDRKGSKVFTIRPTATVKNAVDQMREFGVTALVLKSGDAIFGIVSERDVLNAILRFEEHALSMTVKDIRTLTVITIAPGDSIECAMDLMKHYRVRQLPVIADGRLAGIVSVGDVVKQRLDDLETESNVVRDCTIAAH